MWVDGVNIFMIQERAIVEVIPVRKEERAL
jgi:hypothetical protein